MNNEQFYLYLEERGIELNDYQKMQFNLYCDFLLEYNKITNLTAIRDKGTVYLKHFLDCSSIAFVLQLKDERVLDIGSGAGFPGLVLKILFPNIQLTLIDSNNKKTSFLEKICKKMNFEDVIIINDRVEKLTTKEFYDVIVSRAVTDLRLLAELSLPFLKIGGCALAMKGNLGSELSDSLETIEILGGNQPEVIKLNLPLDLSVHCVLKIVKKQPTDKKFPRVYDKILKYPLKKPNN